MEDFWLMKNASVFDFLQLNEHVNFNLKNYTRSND
jgi:hypothetical protein